MTSVLQVCSFYSHLGGVEKSVSDLVSGLSSLYEVSVLCTKHGSGIERSKDNEVPITKVGGSFALSGRPLATKFPFELGRTNCDVVHYHLPFPLGMAAHMLSAPKSKLKVATWHHDIPKNPLFRQLTMPLMEAFLDSMDVIVSTSPQLIDETEVLRKRRSKCRVVALGIDDEPLSKPSEAAVETLRKKYGNRVVLFVGRLVYYKGCEVLLRAAAGLDATVLFVGEGPMRQDLETVRNELNLNERVHFLGRLPDEELHDLYKASDVFVLPSTHSTECFGLVQVEAMLAGKPVVNTQLPTGVPWVSLDGETGLTVEPGNIQQLHDALKSLLDDEPKRSEFGANARRRATENFTLKKHVANIAKVYAEFLGPQS